MNAKVRNGRAKLTPEQALEIRRAAVRPRGGITELAVRYGVSRCQIARIRSGSKWPSL